jgi:hypothetical protein
MDADQFDRLTRHIGAGATRRALFAAVAALVPAGLVESVTWAKKHHHKHKKHKHKGKGKGKDRTQDCAATSGDDGYVISVGAETSYKGKPLRAQQTVQPLEDGGAVKSQLDLTLGGEALLAIGSESSGGVATVTLTYGDAFKGINRARFTNDGSTITGDIDGRAIVPLPADGDPSQAQFTDGNAPPDIQIDAKLAEAIDAVLKQAKQQAAQCDPAARQGQASASNAHKAPQGKAQSGKARHAKSAHRASSRTKAVRSHPENDAVCLALYIPCETGFAGCCAGAVAGCAASLFFAGICAAIGLGLCLVAGERCRRNIRHNAPCCPVACGGDPENLIFGEDPSCCEKGESCLDPNSNTSGCCPAGTYSCHGISCCQNGQTCSPDGLCCPAGKSSCAGVCCSDGACQGDFCCEGEHGSPCGGECCGPFDSCCGGHCCTGICNGNTCCTVGTLPCGSGCCSTVCCNGVCCPSGAECQNGSCVQICAPGENPCRGQCCGGLTPDCCSWGCGSNACTR